MASAGENNGAGWLMAKLKACRAAACSWHGQRKAAKGGESWRIGWRTKASALQPAAENGEMSQLNIENGGVIVAY
jgi:hypothetical protein